MVKITTFITILLCYVSAFADAPKATIDGPLNVKQGQNILIQASDSNATMYAWKIEPSVKIPGGDNAAAYSQYLKGLGFKIEMPNLWEMSEDKRSVRFVSYPGSYSVTLAVANTDGVAVETYKIVVEPVGSNPGPPLPDDPDTPDNPDNPDVPTPNLTGVALEVYNSTKGISKNSEAKDLANAIKTVTSKAAGLGWTKAAIDSAIKDEVASVISTNEQRGRWQNFATFVSSNTKSTNVDQTLEFLNKVVTGLSAI